MHACKKSKQKPCLTVIFCLAFLMPKEKNFVLTYHLFCKPVDLFHMAALLNKGFDFSNAKFHFSVQIRSSLQQVYSTIQSPISYQ